MKLLGITTVIAGLTLALNVGWSEGAAEGGSQLEGEGLAIYGTVRYLGTLEPVFGARVGLYKPNTLDSETIVTTDSGGRFSFRGLEAGRHDLTVRYPDGQADRLRFEKRIDLSGNVPSPEMTLWLAALSSISGRVLSPDGSPLAGACVNLLRSVTLYDQRFLAGPDVMPPLQPCETDGEGRYRLIVSAGDYYLRVGVPGGAGQTPEQYYPGVSRPEEAVPIAMRPGGDLPGMNIQLVRDDAYRVRFGVAVPEDLPAAEASVGLAIPDEEILEAWLRSVGPFALDSGFRRIELEWLGVGRWQTPLLIPGPYELLLRYRARVASAMRLAEPYGAPRDPIAVLPIALVDEDLDLGPVPAASSIPVPGRVVVRSRRGGMVNPDQMPTLSFDLGPIMRTVESEPDGTFLIEDLWPGLFRFSVREFVPYEPLPEGWYVASVRSGAQDVLNDGLRVGGIVSPIEVVIADDGGQIEGVVRSADEELIPEARVVLIPVRRGPFTEFPAVVATLAGTFTFEDVPPGEYRMLALDRPERSGTMAIPYWQSDEFVREYELAGERITVDPDARIRIEADAISPRPVP